MDKWIQFFHDNWRVILPLAVGLYGALLSTFNFVQSRREKRRDVRLDLNRFVMTGMNGGVLGGGGIGLRMVNHGVKCVIENYYIQVEGHDWKYHLDNNSVAFPLSMEPDDSQSLFESPGIIALAMRDKGHAGNVAIRAFAEERRGKRFASNRFLINIEKEIEIKDRRDAEREEYARKLAKDAASQPPRPDPFPSLSRLGETIARRRAGKGLIDE